MMHMDPPELVDALMEPMMMVVGTMVALSGAYMAIVIDELAARYFKDRDFVFLVECVCGVGLFFFFKSSVMLHFVFFRSSVFYVLLLIFVKNISIISLYYLHYSNALALAAAGLGGKKKKK